MPIVLPIWSLSRDCLTVFSHYLTVIISPSIHLTYLSCHSDPCTRNGDTTRRQIYFHNLKFLMPIVLPIWSLYHDCLTVFSHYLPVIISQSIHLTPCLAIVISAPWLSLIWISAYSPNCSGQRGRWNKTLGRPGTTTNPDECIFPKYNFMCHNYDFPYIKHACICHKYYCIHPQNYCNCPKNNLIDITYKCIFKESALGRFFHRVAMSVHMRVCVFVCPFSCGIFWGLFCPHFPKSDVQNF